jgi:DNA-binding transcriptional LysR family regulator
MMHVGFCSKRMRQPCEPCAQFRARQPEAELQLYPSSSSQQIDEVRSRRLDAGFVFSMPKSDRDLDQLKVAIHPLVLAAPKGHPLTKQKKLRLLDMRDTSFIWFPRWKSPVLHDQVTRECVRGGLKTLNIIESDAQDPRLAFRRWPNPAACLALCRAGSE